MKYYLTSLGFYKEVLTFLLANLCTAHKEKKGVGMR